MPDRRSCTDDQDQTAPEAYAAVAAYSRCQILRDDVLPGLCPTADHLAGVGLARLFLRRHLTLEDEAGGERESMDAHLFADAVLEPLFFLFEGETVRARADQVGADGRQLIV